MERTITNRQVYQYIKDFIATNGVSPTYADIADGCDISSTSVVSKILDELDQAGLIVRVPRMHRNIKIVTQE